MCFKMIVKMVYYIRVLGTFDPHISIKEPINGLNSAGLSAKFRFDPNDWNQRLRNEKKRIKIG